MAVTGRQPQDIDEEQQETIPIQETVFWNELMDDVFGARKGGAIIFIDAENARKGVAKTSGAVALARLLSRAFRYELKKDDMTLSGTEYLKRYQEHPGEEQPSVLVIDELVGAGAGDKRRAMSNQNVDIGRAWQLLRAKRVITLTTLPDWNEVDRRLKKLADYRIWCREKPIGVFQPYKVTLPFDSGGNSAPIGTKGLVRYRGGTRRIRFPDMTDGRDECYEYLAAQKKELLDSETWDADELAEGEEGEEEEKSEEQIRKEESIKAVVRLCKPWDDEHGASQKEAASAVTYSESWVGNRIREWRDGEHRHLVEAPERAKA